MPEDFNSQVTFGVIVAPFSRVDTEAVEGFESAVAEVVCVLGVRIEVAEAWDDEPFVDGGAGVGDVVVAQYEREANSSAEEDVLDASEQGAGIL